MKIIKAKMILVGILLVTCILGTNSALAESYVNAAWTNGYYTSQTVIKSKDEVIHDYNSYTEICFPGDGYEDCRIDVHGQYYDTESGYYHTFDTDSSQWSRYHATLEYKKAETTSCRIYFDNEYYSGTYSIQNAGTFY